MKLSAVHSEEYKGFTIEIHQDEDGPNPRKDFDPVGTMVCWHRRYNLGDEQPKNDPIEFLEELTREYLEDSIDRVEDIIYNSTMKQEHHVERARAILRREQAKVLKEKFAILPLFLYDHSGISMSTGSFGDPWDSGQVGFIYVTADCAMKEWGDDWRKKAEECLKAEVEEYSAYLEGNIWGYVIEPITTEEGTPEVEELENNSCWGFIGEYTYALKEAKSVIDWHTGQKTKAA